MESPFSSASEALKSIPIPAPPPPPARAIYDRVAKWVNEEKKALQSNEELSISCFLPGGARIMVKAIGYVGASLLRVDGSDEAGQSIKALIHHTHSCLTFAVKTIEPNKPRREIGFSGGVDEKVP